MNSGVRFFPFSKRRFRCPECRRWLTRTKAGARACFYSEHHDDSAVLYERAAHSQSRGDS